jgi:NAD(P)-dependent dehydrogenase (short-subunit alcohol dehydrogenase family)
VTIEIDLVGKAAIVTGAGAGIGREIARWLARAGAAVAVNDIRAEPAQAVVDEIIAEGGRAIVAVANVRDEAAVDAMTADVVDRLGSLDILVNNVGMTAGRPAMPLVDVDTEHIRDLLDQNVLTAMLCAIATAKVMIDRGRGGVILNVSSGETTRPSPGIEPYAAAKHAVNHLTWTMAVEWGPHGIRVNAIAPGTTLTETVKPVFSDDHVAAIVASTPLRRMVEHDELGRLSVFLCSDLARCITGQLILADAGAHLSRTRPPNIGT